MAEQPTDVERQTLEVSGLPVDVVRKDIRNIHLSVYPPDGRVRLAVPQHIDNEAARLAIIDRLGWIRQQQQELRAQPRQSKREMVTGESHYVWGQRCRLDVIRHTGPARVAHPGPRTLELVVAPDTSADERRTLLERWYREQVKARVPDLLDTWQQTMEVTVTDWGVRTMKTKWGSCNVDARRILLNTELAKKPVPCLEYIIVHELVHLQERHHTERFRQLMSRYLPQWPHRRALLNAAPLAHEDWRY